MPDRPTYRPRLQGAPPPADDLRRRPPAVLPRAAARRGHVQPVLLVPRGPADVPRACTGSPCGPRARPGDAADSPRIVEGAAAIRPGQARTVRRRGGAVLSVEPHPSGLPRRRQRQQPLALWGFVDDDDVPDEGRPRRRRLSAARRRLRRPDARPAAPPLVHRFEAALDCSTSTAASINTSSSAPFAPISAAHMLAADRERGDPASASRT